MAGTAFAELLPALFGVGAAAKADWSLAYVTLHFIVLPALAVVLIGTGVWSAVAASRRNQKPGLVPTIPAVVVSLAYLTALAFDQGPWARNLFE